MNLPRPPAPRKMPPTASASQSLETPMMMHPATMLSKAEPTRRPWYSPMLTVFIQQVEIPPAWVPPERKVWLMVCNDCSFSFFEIHSALSLLLSLTQELRPNAYSPLKIVHASLNAWAPVSHLRHSAVQCSNSSLISPSHANQAVMHAKALEKSKTRTRMRIYSMYWTTTVQSATLVFL